MDEKRENEELDADLEIEDETAEQVTGGKKAAPAKFRGPDQKDRQKVR